MKYLCTIALTALLAWPLQAPADDRNTLVASGSQLARWCKLNTQFELSQQGIHVLNWSSHELLKIETLSVNGRWQREDDLPEIQVYCAAQKGSSLAYAVLTIEDEAIKIYPRDQKTRIQHPGELADWCKHRAAARHLLQHETPYNWRSRHWLKGNTLHVHGGWRIGTDVHYVECEIEKNGLAADARLSRQH